MSQEELYSADAPRPTLSMHPKKFAMWLFLLSVVMIFAAITSAYMVSQAERMAKGAWLTFDMPDTFWYSSAVILVSSITMEWAHAKAVANEFRSLRLAMLITAVLGSVFLVTQVIALAELVEINVYFAGDKSNPAGSYVYVLCALHALHLIAAVMVLGVLFVRVFQHKVHSKNMAGMDMARTFWHFLDGLWIYLFLFLLFTRI